MTGLERIQAAFNRWAGAGQAAFMPYHPVGYPTRDQSVAIVQRMAAAGADLFEIGFPFSDPLADGPIIQEATHRALTQGITTADCLQMGAELRSAGITQPFCAMSYVNPIFNYGEADFVRDATAAGFDGLIVPDLPPEEGEELEALCQEAGMALSYMLAPSSSEARIRLVTQRSTGFVYLVSVLGTTGARKELPLYLADLVARLRPYTTIPLCLGFGISNGTHAAQVAQLLDGVIVGSALVRAAGADDALEAVSALATELAQGSHGMPI